MSCRGLSKTWINADGGFFLLLAAMLLLLPLKWVMAMILGACVHELCHYFAVILLRGRIYGLRLGFGGAKMEIEPMPPWKELISSLAGPLGSAMLVLTAKWWPRLAICGFIQCLFNLLPLFPLDGGRALRAVLGALLPAFRAERVFLGSQRAFGWILMGMCLLLVLKFGIVPAAAVFVLLLRQRKGTERIGK